MWTTLLQWGTQMLHDKGIAFAERDARWLLEDIVPYHPAVTLSPKQESEYRRAITRRSEGEPWQYIVGSVSFLGCDIAVNPSVLIPRQETEQLTEQVISFLQTHSPFDNPTLLDLCCGSGCIGIAIQKQCPNVTVIGLDISEKAVALAKQNARQNGVAIDYTVDDLFHPKTTPSVHFVVCNPPYVSHAEYAELEREVTAHEPALALLAKENGLQFYRRLAELLPTLLLPSGSAWLEIGATQGKAAASLFSSPIWSSQIQKDWSQRDRFLFLSRR